MSTLSAMWFVVGLAVALIVVACSAAAVTSPSPQSSSPTIRYVALGDSYTIGTSVGQAQSWPTQLVQRLAGRVPLSLVANLGINGFSTLDLIDDELPRLDALHADFFTLLIGVNDVVRGTPAGPYRANVTVIFDDLLTRVPANRIVVVSTPDYTLTPSGAAFGDPHQQSAAIADFNTIEQQMAAARGIAFVDISSVANRVPTDSGLVAFDGLHPSGKQYAGWVDLLAPVVATLFGR